MPLLAMDNNGEIYEAASYRPDGKGFERSAKMSGMGDVALEAPYLKAAQKLNNEHDKLKKLRLAEDAANEIAKRRRAYKIKLANEMEKASNNLLNVNQKALTHAAVLQGLHGADFDQLSLSGYGKSSDGLRGDNMKQKAVNTALLQGMGEEVTMAEVEAIYDLSPAEMEQHILEEEAKIAKAVQDEVKSSESSGIDNRKPERVDIPMYSSPGITKQILTAQASSEAASLNLETQKLKAEQNKKLLMYGIGALVLLKLLK